MVITVLTQEPLVMHQSTSRCCNVISANHPVITNSRIDARKPGRIPQSNRALFIKTHMLQAAASEHQLPAPPQDVQRCLL